MFEKTELEILEERKKAVQDDLERMRRDMSNIANGNNPQYGATWQKYDSINTAYYYKLEELKDIEGEIAVKRCPWRDDHQDGKKRQAWTPSGRSHSSSPALDKGIFRWLLDELFGLLLMVGGVVGFILIIVGILWGIFFLATHWGEIRRIWMTLPLVILAVVTLASFLLDFFGVLWRSSDFTFLRATSGKGVFIALNAISGYVAMQNILKYKDVGINAGTVLKQIPTALTGMLICLGIEALCRNIQDFHSLKRRILGHPFLWRAWGVAFVCLLALLLFGRFPPFLKQCENLFHFWK